MKRGTARHHKIDELADALDIERPHALGLIASLWDWTAETCPAGDIGKATNRTIASRCEWKGNPDSFISALVKARLVDVHNTSRLIIHDWPEHCDDGVHTYMARRRLLFADGTAPRLRHLHSREREDAEKEYSALLAQKPVPPPIVEPAADVPRNVQGQNAVGTVRIDTDRNGSDRDVSGRDLPDATAPSDRHSGQHLTLKEARGCDELIEVCCELFRPQGTAGRDWMIPLYHLTKIATFVDSLTKKPALIAGVERYTHEEEIVKSITDLISKNKPVSVNALCNFIQSVWERCQREGNMPGAAIVRTQLAVETRAESKPQGASEEYLAAIVAEAERMGKRNKR